ncbi:hypothetical protein [Sinorhizobium meliloti]|uniref:hypothetical protein n=1 Tax=Rhizobium meliloti TaxID=382 RepID=UPI001F23692F|nr:hypothetical protein [Sinorhizobium meliloti]
MTDTPQQFIDWFVKNYPGPDTVIFDPKWHAPKIYRAAIAPAYSEITESYRSSLRMIREAIETIFGPMANLESEEAELLRGPEPHHTAEVIIAALQNVAAIPRERREVKEIIAAQVQSVCDWDDRTSPDDCPNHLLITPEELKEILENVADLASDRIRSCLLDKPEAVEGEEARQIIRGFLACPEVADCAPEDLDNETRDLERRARKFLATLAPDHADAAQSGGEAFDKIVAARKAHVDAVAAYNARLEFVRAERERGNRLNVDPEYAAMSEAQSAFYRTVQELADAAFKGDSA